MDDRERRKRDGRLARALDCIRETERSAKLAATYAARGKRDAAGRNASRAASFADTAAVLVNGYAADHDPTHPDHKPEETPAPTTEAATADHAKTVEMPDTTDTRLVNAALHAAHAAAHAKRADELAGDAADYAGNVAHDLDRAASHAANAIRAAANARIASAAANARAVSAAECIANYANAKKEETPAPISKAAATAAGAPPVVDRDPAYSAALDALLDYVEKDERKDYEGRREAGESVKGHIYQHIITLRAHQDAAPAGKYDMIEDMPTSTVNATLDALEAAGILPAEGVALIHEDIERYFQRKS